jgi:hypothetical protein
MGGALKREAGAHVRVDLDDGTYWEVGRDLI